MFCPSKLFSFVFVTQIIIILGQFNDSTFYYPDDKQGKVHSVSNSRKSVLLTPSELESMRGTSAYDRYVNEIIASGISRLTVTMNGMLTDPPISNNVVFSPVSIAGVLALVLLGANGVTFKEISQLMGLAAGIPDIDKKSQLVHEQFSILISQLVATSGFDVGEQVNFATAMFVQSGYPIRPLYKSTAEELYKSDILNMDFRGNPASAQQQVNRWVEQHTNGKIKSILNDLPSSDTKVILASALYFNAEWEHHFIDGATRKRPFYVNGRNSKSAHDVFMMSNGGEFPYYQDAHLGCEILGLPYKDKKSTMYIIMPFDSSKEILHQFESRLTDKDLERLIGNTKKTGAVILFPKMRLESTIDLKKTLESLNVKSLFDPRQANLALLSPGEFTTRLNDLNATEMNVTQEIVKPLNLPSTTTQSTLTDKLSSRQGRANFTEDKVTAQPIPSIASRLTESLDDIRRIINEQSSDNNYQNPRLYAEQVIHKVYMDITEKGTEAAAATSVSLTRDGSRVTFRVDVPFLFFIRHEETKTILFWGSVVLPTSS